MLLVLFPLLAVSQVDSLDAYLERLIEQFAEENDASDFDYTTQLEMLEGIRKNPFDINKVSEEELSNLFFLSPTQRKQIIVHRETYGQFLAVEELQNIDVLDMTLIRVLRYYLTLAQKHNKQFSLKSVMNEAQQVLFFKYKRVLQERKGFQSTQGESPAYLGDANHYFIRYRMESNNNFRMGFTAEKDPGESLAFKNGRKGFDFYSAFVSIKNINRWLSHVILGDYTVSMGQGLILHNDFGAGKTAFVMNIKRSGNVIKPYSSVNEANYFRGLALTSKLNPNTELSLFYSMKKIDGNIQTDTLAEDGFETVSSLLRSGYHRTTSEIAHRNALSQQNYGGRLKYTKGALQLGVHHLGYEFSKPYSRGDEVYNLYAFRGKALYNSGLDYSVYWRNITAFGELAVSNNESKAMIHSLLMALDKKVDISMSFRKFEPSYQVIEANAFGEASQPINESGFYTGMEVRPSSKWKISSYVDFWKHPWLRYRVDAPSAGREILVRADYTIKRKFNIYLQYRYEQKNINTSLGGEKIDGVVTTSQQRLRLHMSHKLNKELEFRTRAEFCWFQKEDRPINGYLIYQDVIYKPLAKPYSFNVRYALFDSDGFDTRIYAYENDILYEFAVPFYSNTGRRFYINGRYKINRLLTWELRYATTRYSDLDVISSGSNDEIPGSSRSEIKTQLRMSF
ncbi:MAG: helix-hairpin-helix domain-containing protein [Saprospiraceae bacterium]|nr:helix-hairpin-helix domain-containing protein [Saprospiraceae bacterium]